MLKKIVKKHHKGPEPSSLAVNDAIQVAPLIDLEEETQKETRFKNDHVEYLRVARKPLQFGIEEVLTYPQHLHMNIEGSLQNFNNKVYATWDLKSLHIWRMDSGARAHHVKMIDVTKTHCTITAVAFSHKYRLYLVITSQFKFIFLNELCYVVTMLDMSELSTVNFVHFNDQQNQLITAGIKGIFIHNFKYSGKYLPKLAATIDFTGKYIEIEFIQKRLLEPIVPWIKGMKIDQKSGVIITWSQGKLPGNNKGGAKAGGSAMSFNKATVCFNWLNCRPPNGGDNGARLEETVDDATMNKTVEAIKKLIVSQKPCDGIIEGTNDILKSVEEKTILVVVLATDITDQKFKKNFLAKTSACNAQVIEIGTRDDLGAWLGHCKYDKHKKPIKITPTTLFALKDYGDEFDSYQLIRSYIKQQKIIKQNMTGQLIALFKDIMDYGEQILDVLVFIDYRYFLVSTDDGNIYVFKYVQSGKVEANKRLIHTYSGHNKNATQLMQMQNYPHLFMSVSLDGTARVWSLESFSHLYTIEIPGALRYCTIFSRCQYILSQDADVVQLHQLHMILENYMNAESQVVQISPGYRTLDDKDTGKSSFTISISQDNSAVIKDIDDSLASYDKTTLYPPPSAQTIKKIVYSTFLDRMILLLSSSTICVYKRVKETALLEKILDPSEIKDCEMKRAFSQQVTSMEIIHTNAETQLLPFDTEVLNIRLHEGVLGEALADKSEKKEFIVLGLSKGAILLFHVAQISQLYCRFTLHREKIKFIKFLANTRVFLSVCIEGDMIFWQLTEDRKVNKICQYKVPAGKIVKKVTLIAKAYHRQSPDVLNDRVMIIFKSGESELFDFEIGNKVTYAEGEEANSANAHLFLVENEKQKEHDCKVTGVDSNKDARLMVTSDIGGSVKIWSLEKRFMREIQFPHPVDSVCFLNEKGDILVSHVHRISLVRFDTYWTSSFTHFGFTEVQSEIHEKYKREEATIETELFDDYICDKAPPTRTRIVDQDHFESLLRSKSEDENPQNNLSKLSKASLGRSGAFTKNAASIEGLKGQSAMETNNLSSRLGDSALRKMQQTMNPFYSSQQDFTKTGTKVKNKVKAVSNAIGAASFLSKLSNHGGLQTTNDLAEVAAAQTNSFMQASQNPMLQTGGGSLSLKQTMGQKPKASSVQPVRAIRVRPNHSMTMFQLKELEDQVERQRIADEEKARADYLKRINGPAAMDAIPREINPFAHKQVLQPLPGISYLSTSPVYYEMLAKRKKQKGQLSKGMTRRKITENRISSNIMNFNSPTAVGDFSDMELSIDYHTQVSQQKYNTSNFLPLMNLQILSKIPIEQILNPNFEIGSQTQPLQNHELGLPPNAAELDMSLHSRKSRSNLPFRTNSFGGGVGASDRQSRNTNRSGKETAASHITQGSLRHSLVKPIGLDGQPHFQLDGSFSHIQSNGRNSKKQTQRTNIAMTGNQIVGGNLSYPRTTRNMAANQIVFHNSNQEGGQPLDNSMIQFDHRGGIATHVDQSLTNNNAITDTSVGVGPQSSFLGSEIKRGEAEVSQIGGAQPSQTTQETSKQVFGKHMVSPSSLGVSKHSDMTAGRTGVKATDISMIGGELQSIKEDQGGTTIGGQKTSQQQNVNADGLGHDDSIIENDQPSVILPKVRLPVNDYKGGAGEGALPDKGMGITGDSFADSIMSNHYQNK